MRFPSRTANGWKAAAVTNFAPSLRASSSMRKAQAVVQHAETLPHLAQRAARGEWGVLRLGVIPPAATPAVAEALRRFAAQFPDVEIQVRQSDQEKLLLRLGSGDLDLVLGRPDDKDRPPEIHTRRLFVEEQGVVLREDDRRARRPAIGLKALASSPLLLLRGNPHFGQLLLEHARKHGVELRALHTADDFPSLHWLVRAGLGVAPVSLLLGEGLPRGLVAKPLKPAPPKLEIHALWRGATPPPTAARLLQMSGKGFA
jgi:DNA-binding transcriptional LysR family regulator